MFIVFNTTKMLRSHLIRGAANVDVNFGAAASAAADDDDDH